MDQRQRFTHPTLGMPLVLLLIILFLPSGGLVSYVLLTEAWGNFHTVTEGFIYRSGQLTSVDLTYMIDRYRIRSILNLRGKNTGSRWYQEETDVANSHGVVHYDYGISANRELENLDIRNILAIIRAAPKPLLIHCKAGSDRTGLIAALYLHEIEGVDAQKASRELSVLYGHFPYLWSNTDAMDRTFWRYVADHRQQRQSGPRSLTQGEPAGHLSEGGADGSDSERDSRRMQ